MQSALATIVTIICRTHIEPLSSKAAAAFAIKNFRYFGLPMQLILLAFVNTILALVIWIFGTYGLIGGLFASVTSGFGMWCVLFIWGSVMGWENEELSEKVRDKRERLRKEIWKTLFPFNLCPWLIDFPFNVYHWIKKVCKDSSVYKRIVSVFQAGYPQNLSDAIDAAKAAGVNPEMVTVAEAALAAQQGEALEAGAAAKAKTERRRQRTAEAKLNAAMLLPVQQANSATKLKPAIEAARAAGVSEALLASAEAALAETLDHAREEGARAAEAALKAAMPPPLRGSRAAHQTSSARQMSTSDEHI